MFCSTEMKFKKLVKKVITKKGAKAAMKYAAAGLTGYEVGEMIEHVAEVLSEPKAPSQPNRPMEGKIELNPSVGLANALFDIKLLLIIILIAVLFACMIGLGYKTYSAIGRRTAKKLKRSLETQGKLKFKNI